MAPQHRSSGLGLEWMSEETINVPLAKTTSDTTSVHSGRYVHLPRHTDMTLFGRVQPRDRRDSWTDISVDLGSGKGNSSKPHVTASLNRAQLCGMCNQQLLHSVVVCQSDLPHSCVDGSSTPQGAYRQFFHGQNTNDSRVSVMYTQIPLSDHIGSLP